MRKNDAKFIGLTALELSFSPSSLEKRVQVLVIFLPGHKLGTAQVGARNGPSWHWERPKLALGTARKLKKKEVFSNMQKDTVVETLSIAENGALSSQTAFFMPKAFIKVDDVHFDQLSNFFEKAHSAKKYFPTITENSFFSCTGPKSNQRGHRERVFVTNGNLS